MIHTEKTFEEAIEQHLLIAGGYTKGNPDSYNRDLALFPESLLRFLRASQANELAKLEAIHGPLTEEKLIERLTKELEANGTLHVLRKGITDHGCKFSLAYFQPETGLNPDTQLHYDQNILEVTRQVKYNPKNENSLDMVLSLNGIPVATIELKNEFTGQNVTNAERQYKFDREPNSPIFRHTKRSLVHFAVDSENVRMTTKLSGRDTYFLPFNKGNNKGAGNPLNPKGYKTSYLWEEVLVKDSWLDILGRFAHVQKEKIESDPAGREKISVIFPRYHQLDVVRKLASDARSNGAGKNYLIQHSAGSGKSNSIAWTAYRLSSLHNSKDERIFDSVIVITDRKVLDKQLQDTIFQFEHKSGVVQKIDQNTAQLMDALFTGKNIIISTVQKFPIVLRKIQEEPTNGLPKRKYAVIIDEAHSSQGGETARALREVLAAKSLEEAEEIDSELDNVEDFEDELQKVLVSRSATQDNLSFLAFTATPKAKTLKSFGHKDEFGEDAPFHLYSMRQAIEEGFILDVLKGYTTYKTFYKLSKAIEEDPELNKTKATRAIGRFFSLHPYNIAQKVEVIIEHFQNVVSKKIGGKAKAMVVTSSRLHAVRYYQEFNKYIKEKKYTNLKALVAFSGVVRDSGEEYKETQLNNIGEKELPKKFNTAEYQVLIVADKYQTGFDQPLLHTMYVDKKLSGVRAVQTLSRLNRTCTGKDDTFVLDFVNDTEIIQESFQPYYEQTKLSEDIDPNLLYSQKTRIEEKQVIWQTEIDNFCKVFFRSKKQLTVSDQAKLYSYIDTAVDRFKAIPVEEERDEYEKLLQDFVRAYSFLSQVVPFVDVELEKLFTYIRYLLKKLPKDDYKERLRLDDNVALEYYRLQKISEGDIPLAINGDAGVKPPTETGLTKEKEEKSRLSQIIAEINEKFGTEFTEANRLWVDSICEVVKSDELLKQQALNNPLQNYKLGVSDKFPDMAIDRMDSDRDFFDKVMENQGMRDIVVSYIARVSYDAIRKAHGINP